MNASPNHRTLRLPQAVIQQIERLTQNIGEHAMTVGAQGAESTLDNALTHLNEFGIKRPRALALVAEVVRAVNHWQAHFIQCGVCLADMAQLSASIDRDALKIQRLAF